MTTPTRSGQSLFLVTGQSLIEILISVTIAGLIVLGTSNVITVTSRLTSQNKELQTASFLAGQFAENLTIYTDGKWFCAGGTCSSDGLARGIYNLNKGSTNTYYLSTNSSPFIWVSGSENVSIPGQTTIYNRYFYVENVCRDNADRSITGVQGGGCAVGSTEDSSTQKTIVVVSWQKMGQNFDFRLEKYLTRSGNASFFQTDWSGGGGQTAIFNDQTKYDSDNGSINFSGARGSLKISGY